MANGTVPLIVTAPEGTDLRREPHTSPKTENGEDNVIRSLPKNTYLRLEKEDIYATSKYQWVFVSLQVESKTITGWVIVDDLTIASLDASSGPTYPVSFRGNSYEMPQDLLQPAIQARYIMRFHSDWRSFRGLEEITINGSQYFTTELNVGVMKSTGWIR